LGVLFCIHIKSIKTNCNGEYINIDPSNTPCVNDLNAVTEVSEHVVKKFYSFLHESTLLIYHLKFVVHQKDI
jgi:hypothetical protein